MEPLYNPDIKHLIESNYHVDWETLQFRKLGIECHRILEEGLSDIRNLTRAGDVDINGVLGSEVSRHRQDKKTPETD